MLITQFPDELPFGKLGLIIDGLTGKPIDYRDAVLTAANVVLYCLGQGLPVSIDMSPIPAPVMQAGDADIADVDPVAVVSHGVANPHAVSGDRVFLKSLLSLALELLLKFGPLAFEKQPIASTAP